MNSALFNDLARLAIQFASRSMAAKQKTSVSSIALVACALVLGVGAVTSFLIAAWIFAERQFGHQVAPIAMGTVFLVLAFVALLIANYKQKQMQKARQAAVNREEVALQMALLLKDHKGLVLLSALAAGLLAGTSK